MSRNKWFDHRITVTMTEDMLVEIERTRRPGEIRLDFIRGALEAEIKRRKAEAVTARGKVFDPRRRAGALSTA
jgi:hypothetical protein